MLTNSSPDAPRRGPNPPFLEARDHQAFVAMFVLKLLLKRSLTYIRTYVRTYLRLAGFYRNTYVRTCASPAIQVMPLCKGLTIMGDAMITIPAGRNPASAQRSATAQNPASAPTPRTMQHNGARSVPACAKPVQPQTPLRCRSEGAKFRPAQPKKGFGLPKTISSEDAHLPIAYGALPCDADGEEAHQPIDGIGGHCAADGERDVDDVDAGFARASLNDGLSQGAVTCDSSSSEGSVSSFSARSRSPRPTLPIRAGPAPNGPNDGDREASRPPRPNQTISCSAAANPIPGVPH